MQEEKYSFYIGEFTGKKVEYPVEGISVGNLQTKLEKKCSGLGIESNALQNQIKSITTELQENNIHNINGQGCITAIIVKVNGKDYLLQTINPNKEHSFQEKITKGCIGHIGGYSKNMDETFKKCFGREMEEEAGTKTTITLDSDMYNTFIGLGVTSVNPKIHNIDAKITLIHKKKNSRFEECFKELGLQGFGQPITFDTLTKENEACSSFMKKVNTCGVDKEELYCAKGGDDAPFIVAIPIEELEQYKPLYDKGSLGVAESATKKLEEEKQNAIERAKIPVLCESLISNSNLKTKINNPAQWNSSTKIAYAPYQPSIFNIAPYSSNSNFMACKESRTKETEYNINLRKAQTSNPYFGK